MNKRLHSEEEKIKIRVSKQQTALRHASMDVKVYELKIVEKRLNKQQKEQLSLMFLEGKWFYNYILSEKKKRDIPLHFINPTDFKEILKFDKDKNEITYKLYCLLILNRRYI